MATSPCGEYSPHIRFVTAATLRCSNKNAPQRGVSGIRLAPAKLGRIMMSEAVGTRRSSCVRHFSVLIRFVAKVGGAEYETHAYVDRGIDFQLGFA